VRRTPLTIGIVVAELAVGALATAPPAGADGAPAPPVAAGDDHGAEPPPTSPTPAAAEPVTRLVRSGRATDLLEPPAQLPELPIAAGTDTTPEPPASSETPAPTPSPAPLPQHPVPAAPAAPGPVPTSPAAGPGSSPVPAAGAPPSRVVAPGDSLWEIAASHLAQTSGRDRAALGPADIAGYWVRLCEANRGRLQSGDLNLIYAGEVVELPPV